jgi:hypothetical protein
MGSHFPHPDSHARARVRPIMGKIAPYTPFLDRDLQKIPAAQVISCRELTEELLPVQGAVAPCQANWTIDRARRPAISTVRQTSVKQTSQKGNT